MSENRPPKMQEGDGVFSSSLARAADHFAAKDTDPADKVEIWAKRIGRFFSVFAFIGLAWYFGHQLKWW
ncbi:MAG: hypothetical protein J0L51_07825 [Rhizobiales bacterium]|nr:hypothetical protein [Hyphomicrobiales bacterium]